MSMYVIATTISIVVATASLSALLFDRSARERAWRRIADDRRWNADSASGRNRQ